MPALTEANNLGDLLKYEAPNLYSRDRVTVASGKAEKLSALVGPVPNWREINGHLVEFATPGLWPTY